MSFKKAEYHEVSATLLFIAGKLGSGRNFVGIDQIIHHIVRDCCKDPIKRALIDSSEGSKDYQYWSAAIFYYEDVILETLCFDDYPKIPHTYALEVIREFNGSKLLQHTAFLYCNDALCTTLAVRYPAHTIAYAAIHAALEACGQHLVNANDTQWWATKGLNLAHLKVLAMEISIASDPILLAAWFDKIVAKVSGSVGGCIDALPPPHTPPFESSPLSNAETACNVPVSGAGVFKTTKSHTLPPPPPPPVTSFF